MQMALQGFAFCHAGYHGYGRMLRPVAPETLAFRPRRSLRRELATCAFGLAAWRRGASGAKRLDSLDSALRLFALSASRTQRAATDAESSEPTTESTLLAFRTVLKQHGLKAYIVPTDDPHMSEIPPDCFARRKFLTGFTGSAGTAVVTDLEALLWTDGRYFQQAALELGSSWILMKSGLPSTPSLSDWLATNLQKGDLVGIDPNVHAATFATELQTKLEKEGVELRATQNLVDEIWKHRPAFPSAAVRVHPLELAGSTVAEKLSKVKEELTKKEVDLLAVTSLDEVSPLGFCAGSGSHRFPWLNASL